MDGRVWLEYWWCKKPEVVMTWGMQIEGLLVKGKNTKFWNLDCILEASKNHSGFMNSGTSHTKIEHTWRRGGWMLGRENGSGKLLYFLQGMTRIWAWVVFLEIERWDSTHKIASIWWQLRCGKKRERWGQGFLMFLTWLTRKIVVFLIGTQKEKWYCLSLFGLLQLG